MIPVLTVLVFGVIVTDVPIACHLKISLSPFTVSPTYTFRANCHLVVMIMTIVVDGENPKYPLSVSLS